METKNIKDSKKLDTESFRHYRVMHVTILNKVYMSVDHFNISVGDTITFQRLTITSLACVMRLPEDFPETAGYLLIKKAGNQLSDRKLFFQGYMFAQSPGLNAFEHPYYDVWVTGCSKQT